MHATRKTPVTEVSIHNFTLGSGVSDDDSWKGPVYSSKGGERLKNAPPELQSTVRRDGYGE